MRPSKTIGIILTILMGLSLALTSKAEDAPKKKPVKKIVSKPMPPMPAPAAAPINTSSAKVTAVELPKEEVKKPWHVDLTAEFYPENNVQPDAFIFWVANPSYTFAKYHRFEIVQRAIQTTLPEPGKQAEFNALNPRIDYTYSFTEPDAKDISVSIRFRSELGTSGSSLANGVNSINSVRLNFKKLLGNFYFGLRPYVAYYSTKFATDATGQPLPFMAVGHNLALGYNFTSKFSWNLEADTAVKLMQPGEVARAVQLQQQAAIPGAQPVSTDTSSTAMFLSTEFAYQAASNIAVRLGYYQDDKMVTDGKYAINFLDQSTTRFYIGFDYGF